MAKQGWAGMSEGQVVRRLGKRLGLEFAEGGVGPGGTPGGSRGEVMGWIASAGDDAWVAVEFEQKHAHPAENVLQYWPRLERNRHRLVLLHAIAPDARRREGQRSELTKWLGSLMERVIPGRFTYCRVELDSSAEAAQLEAAAVAIAGLRQPHVKAGPAAGL